MDSAGIETSDHCLFKYTEDRNSKFNSQVKAPMFLVTFKFAVLLRHALH